MRANFWSYSPAASYKFQSAPPYEGERETKRVIGVIGCFNPRPRMRANNIQDAIAIARKVSIRAPV